MSEYTYTSKPKEFKWLAGLLLISMLVWVVTIIDFQDLSANWEKASGLFVLAVALFYFFWSYGNKKRSIIITDNKVEYTNPKLHFSAKFEDIILVKSFQDVNKSTENLIVMTEDDTLSISSAFFDIEKLIDCYNKLITIAKNYDNITVEDDRAWAENNETNNPISEV